jgi:DNA helicase HerA-like ATPase
MQVIAESLSRIGVPTFMADVKGDVAGIAAQQGVLALVFKIADDRGLLVLDLKDLRGMLQFVGDNASAFKTEYGNVSAASVGAIQRGLLELEQQGADRFFGEPSLNIADFIQTARHRARYGQPPRRGYADPDA